VHLVGFTIEIYYDARLCERQTQRQVVFVDCKRNFEQGFPGSTSKWHLCERNNLILFCYGSSRRFISRGALWNTSILFILCWYCSTLHTNRTTYRLQDNI